MDVVFLEFIKAFGTVSHNILLGELRKRALDEQSEVIGHWLDSRAQRAVSRCRVRLEAAAHGVPGGQRWAQSVHLIHSELDEGTECTLSEFAGGSIVGGEADAPERCAAVQ